MKRFVFGISVLLITACGAQSARQEEKKEMENTKTVKIDSVLTISLPADAGRGFSWQLADSAFAKQLLYTGQTYTEAAGEEKDGAAGMQHFQFKGLLPGKVALHFIYVQPFVKPYPKDAPTKAFTVTIQ